MHLLLDPLSSVFPLHFILNSPVLLFLKINFVVSLAKSHIDISPPSSFGTSTFCKAVINIGTISSGSSEGLGEPAPISKLNDGGGVVDVAESCFCPTAFVLFPSVFSSSLSWKRDRNNSSSDGSECNSVLVVAAECIQKDSPFVLCEILLVQIPLLRLLNASVFRIEVAGRMESGATSPTIIPGRRA